MVSQAQHLTVGLFFLRGQSHFFQQTLLSKLGELAADLVHRGALAYQDLCLAQFPDNLLRLKSLLRHPDLLFPLRSGPEL